MQQGGDKVVTVTRGGDGGVKKSFPQVFLPNALQQKPAIAEYAQSCLVKLGFHKFPDEPGVLYSYTSVVSR